MPEPFHIICHITIRVVSKCLSELGLILCYVSMIELNMSVQ